MSKVVLVVSFDEPESQEAFDSTIGATLDALQPILGNQANRHVWLGIKDQADIVLNTIGVD